MNRLLSKSQYLRGLQCGKSLWLYRNKPELRTPPDKAQQAVFETGTAIGMLARELFPNGSAVVFEGSTFEEKVARTREFINAGVETIYEATFAYDDVLVMVDILHHGIRGWELYEVKSSTDLKDSHINDVAVQYHVLAGNGLRVSKASLVHINNEYVRYGNLELNKLFTIKDLTSVVEELQDTVGNDISSMRLTVSGDCPTIDIGPHCSNPYDCDFMSHCWSHVPKSSVFDIARLNSVKKFELYYKGIVEFKSIPETYPLNPNQRMQVESELTGKTFINQAGINDFLGTLRYPLYFLDFETFQLAVPLFDGTRPYEQMPFQYSLHSCESEYAECKHSEFLARQGCDPREDLVKRLTTDIPPDACVLAYNMTFEKMVLRNLAGQFTAYASKLMNIHDNMLDLMAPFRSKYYYAKAMQGSYSIKYVLPALVPGLSYHDMAISNGGEAMNAYSTLHLIKDDSEVERIRKALLEYCKLDTFAMVTLLGKLKEAVSINSV